jgi:hypothetical protein
MVEENCLGNGSTWYYSNNMCIAEMFDCEVEPCAPGKLNMFKRMVSNDIDEFKRPHGGYRGLLGESFSCGPSDSGRELCMSQMHLTVQVFFDEFSQPTGGTGSISREEFRALWLEGEYPRDFVKRSPRSCMRLTTDGTACSRCLAEIDATSEDAIFLADACWRRSILRIWFSMTKITSAYAQAWTPVPLGPPAK